MKRTVSFYLLIAFLTCNIFAQERNIKNVILMIPDGTSLATISAARWYQRYNDSGKPKLNIDPYICGTVLTFCSNAPIGDSAPTTSCYMTGIPSRAGYVSTYPVQDPKNDILPMNPVMEYQPLMTLLEAARIVNDMSTGLVFTCEFPHATPADCAAHSYDRNKYEWIAPQMIHNNIDVVIGGGVSFIRNEDVDYLRSQNYGVYLDDIEGFMKHPGDKMWSLFGERDLPYELDRDAEKYPSLAEMTQKAIEKLSNNENGFFLMVEGSKVDWAAHANDAAAMITDFLAFDEAFGVALDFAQKNQETVIVMVPDHGNSGISIGCNNCKGPTSLTKDDLFKSISQFKTSRAILINKLQNTVPEKIKEIFIESTGIELNDNELEDILISEDYKYNKYTGKEPLKGFKLDNSVKKILNDHACFGFTTNSHTGEEVLLAVYDPTENRPTGFIRNTELHSYMAGLLGIEGKLNGYTQDYFMDHKELFHDKKYKYKIKYPKNNNKGNPILEVSHKKKKAIIEPNTNIIKINNKPVHLNSIIVYVDKNDTFYLPFTIADLLE